LDKKFGGFFAGDLRDLRQQNVSQHPILVAESQRFALVGRETRRAEFPFDTALAGFRFIGQHRRAGTVAEKTRADEDTRIVIQKKCRTANLDAYGQNFFGAPRRENRFGIS